MAKVTVGIGFEKFWLSGSMSVPATSNKIAHTKNR